MYFSPLYLLCTAFLVMVGSVQNLSSQLVEGMGDCRNMGLTADVAAEDTGVVVFDVVEDTGIVSLCSHYLQSLYRARSCASDLDANGSVPCVNTPGHVRSRPLHNIGTYPMLSSYLVPSGLWYTLGIATSCALRFFPCCTRDT